MHLLSGVRIDSVTERCLPEVVYAEVDKQASIRSTDIGVFPVTLFIICPFVTVRSPTN